MGGWKHLGKTLGSWPKQRAGISAQIPEDNYVFTY